MRCAFRFRLPFCAAAILAMTAGQLARADVLYIGEAGLGVDTVKRFDAATGVLDPTFAPSGLLGPRGMVIDGDRLLVANQNVDTHLSGEILAYDAATGATLNPVVAEADKDAPYVPRGLVLGFDGDLFVGNFTTAFGKSKGELLRYDATTGELLSNDPVTGFKNHDFHPRGIVFGPDNMLYVASPASISTGLGGAVLRFNADGTFADVFVEDAGGVGQLNRPEGIVFGPDGNLYVTSFRAAPGDVDGIRVYDPDGSFIKQINYYDPATEPRVSAQALLFGPDDKLFVPLLNTGEVRAYDTASGDYETFIAAGTDLVNPVYLTFGLTDPRTLAYGGSGAVVPEPSSLALAGLVGCALLAWSRTSARR